MPQEFLNHATRDYSVRGTTCFPLDCQIKQWQQPTQQYPSGVNDLKLRYIFFSDQQNKFFGVPTVLVITPCMPWYEKGWKALL